MLVLTLLLATFPKSGPCQVFGRSTLSLLLVVFWSSKVFHHLDTCLRMLATNLFVVGAALVASVVAQGRLAFTSTPGTAVQGSSYNISWSGGDGSAVTLTLRKGDPNDLETIGILGQGIISDSYEWEVSDSLEPDEYVSTELDGNHRLTLATVTMLFKSLSVRTSSIIQVCSPLSQEMAQTRRRRQPRLPPTARRPPPHS